MMNAVATARSGLLASVARLNAAASNIAHSDTAGPVPEAPAAQPAGAPRVYQPVDVVLKTSGEADGSTGVVASYQPRLPAYVRHYDPSSPFANADGMIAAPNVDLAGEAIDILEATLLFKANLAVLKASNEMTRRILDTTA
jgi:flagellar basal-body rod protein FlgC